MPSTEDFKSIARVFDFLSTKEIGNDAEYARIPNVVIDRLREIYAIDAALFVPNPGLPKYVSHYSSQGSGSRLLTETEYLDVLNTYQRDSTWIPVELSFRELDELELLDARATMFLRPAQGSLDSVEATTVAALVKDFLYRCVQRQRATIRRDVILAKLGSSDLSSFLYRVVRDSLLKRLDCEVCSIFVFDPTAGELQLRHSTGLILTNGDRPSMRREANSWISKTYRSQRPMFEFAPSGNLKLGATAERTSEEYRNRIYWPIQIQFKHQATTRRRARRLCAGVLRLGNFGSSDPDVRRPANLFEAFLVEFYCECMFNIIDFFTDKRIEGFERDTAFHSAAAVAHGNLKNIAIARGLLFGNSASDNFLGHQYPIQKQFQLTAQSDAFHETEVQRSMDNAFGYSLDLLSQIERANVTHRMPSGEKSDQKTEKLLADVIMVAVRMIPHFVSSHSIRNAVEINRIFDEKLPPPVRGNATDLLSVFANVFENAIKYGRKEGPISLNVSLIEEADYVRVDISDNGIGIEPDDEQRIFTHGFRGTKAKRHSMRGSGYGLAYCREILKQSQGEISASHRESGLVISVRLRKE